MNTTDYRILGPRTPWTERAQRAAENALVHLQDVKRAWEGVTNGASDEPIAEQDHDRSAADIHHADADAQEADPDDAKEISSPAGEDVDEGESGAEDQDADEGRPERQDARSQGQESQANSVRAVRSMAVKVAPVALAILIARKRGRAKRRKRFFKKIGASVGGAMIGSAAVAAASDRRFERFLAGAKEISTIG